MNFCIGQNTNTTLTLAGNTGTVVNWQRSTDSLNWTDFAPANPASSFGVSNVTANEYYRTIVKSGVCPSDTSDVAAIHFINVPFPVAAIDPDSAYICYGTTIPLNATITTGTSYNWSNTNTLTNTGSGVVTSIPLTLQATASPRKSTNYVLTVNKAGCPNSLQDTFHIGVAPKIVVDAGNDTAIVSNQPLQLHANVSDPGANLFLWQPPTGLNSTTRPDPIAQFVPEQSGGTITYIVRASNQQGCFGEDTINVKIFTTGPDIFVPGGFTPNGDGKNDVLRPICVGISRLNYFRVFNRWGQLVFSTSQIGAGWDGRISGQPQATGNFVYIAQGVDYTGKIVFRKGNITLLR
ncbi:MAG TPA: gliding motility-associated C-terminal domain-containing protein [Chitinophagaceae bacterium]